MQCSFFVEDLPMAAFTDQLMEEYESQYTYKIREVIQKQRYRSLNIQKQSFKGVLMKRGLQEQRCKASLQDNSYAGV